MSRCVRCHLHIYCATIQTPYNVMMLNGEPRAPEREVFSGFQACDLMPETVGQEQTLRYIKFPLRFFQSSATPDTPQMSSRRRQMRAALCVPEDGCWGSWGEVQPQLLLRIAVRRKCRQYRTKVCAKIETVWYVGRVHPHPQRKRVSKLCGYLVDRVDAVSHLVS